MKNGIFVNENLTFACCQVYLSSESGALSTTISDHDALIVDQICAIRRREAQGKAVVRGTRPMLSAAAAAQHYVFSNFYSNFYTNFWQTLRGSFSVVLKPDFASKYSFESS